MRPGTFGLQREAFPAAVENWFLILAEGSTQVSIEGPGRIVGQAGAWENEYAHALYGVCMFDDRGMHSWQG